MTDLTAQHAALGEEIEAGIREVLRGGRFVLGAHVRAFEQEAAAYLGASHAVTCGSGTDALRLALTALGVGPGDEVITTPFTFFATAEAVLQVGARPVFVDVDPATFNLDPSGVEQALSAATRVLLPVHLFGQPVAMEPLLDLARRHDLWVVEDCAQAFGALRGGRRVGTLGVAGCFSFFPSKNLGACGDGGMVVTGSEPLAARLRELRDHGSVARHHHRRAGFNSRLDELQAVVLRIKLKHVERLNAARRRAARRYHEALAGLPGLVLPVEDAGGQHVFSHYTVLVAERDRIGRLLARQGVASAVHYPLPLHRQPALAGDYGGLRLPAAEAVAARCLSLPMFPELTGAQITAVTGAVCAALRGAA